MSTANLIYNEIQSLINNNLWDAYVGLRGVAAAEKIKPGSKLKKSGNYVDGVKKGTLNGTSVVGLGVADCVELEKIERALKIAKTHGDGLIVLVRDCPEIGGAVEEGNDPGEFIIKTAVAVAVFNMG